MGKAFILKNKQQAGGLRKEREGSKDNPDPLKLSRNATKFSAFIPDVGTIPCSNCSIQTLKVLSNTKTFMVGCNKYSLQKEINV